MIRRDREKRKIYEGGGGEHSPLRRRLVKMGRREALEDGEEEQEKLPS